jgi:cytochrome c oxidase assembly factor CtaG
MDLQSLLTTWSFEPVVLIGTIVAALLYVGGLDYALRRGIGPTIAWWRVLSYYAGLLVIFIALASVVDVEASQLLWVHMVQHDLLTLIGPPLVLLGAPLWPLWRGVPRRLRLWSLSWMMRTRWPWRIASTASRIVGDPRVALCLFMGLFAAWHLPALYDVALYQPAIHIAEHLCFLGTALIFFAQVLPLDGGLTAAHAHRRRLGYAARAVYLCMAALGLNVLGETFIFSTAPFYPYYVGLPRTPQMPSVLVDQHLAGAAMGVPGVTVFFGAVIWALMRWLREDEQAAKAEQEREREPQRAGWTAPPAHTPSGHL